MVRTRVGLVCAALVCVPFAHAVTHASKHATPASPWEQAQRQRAALEAQPDGTRTRAAYTRVLDAFRAIYHDNPRDSHAAEAVYSAAELLAEQGHELEDERSLRAALGQFEFLRAQYPASPLRGPALLAEARIDAADLNDKTTARERLALLLKEAPRSDSARQARSELAALKTPAAEPSKPAYVAEKATDRGPVEVVAPVRHTPLALVTGIRHWSTSTYTRVAIDLGDEVTFEAARVPNPDRIFFDLHGARLAPELVGKSFEITDDGFLKRIRAAQPGGDVTRVVLDVADVTEYSAFLLPNPFRLIIDIHGSKAAQHVEPLPSVPVAAAAVRQASLAASTSGLPAMAPTDGGEAVRPLLPASPVTVTLAVRNRASDRTLTVAKPQTTAEVAAVSDSPGKVEATSAPTSKPIAVNLGTNTRKASATAAAPAKAAEKTADGETSLIRALGLKIGRIVIDAGHGGHDSGTLGVDGIQEKDVVLDVALRLGKLLHDRLGAEIIYTRSDDTFIPLETRTAIANKAQADLFLSIHANSSPDATARGVETYYLNFTSDASALDVAARENAVSDQSIHQLSDLVKKITLKDKIAESHEFASDVEGSLFAGLTRGNDGLKNRGVKKAPFVVLIGANMPSILAEISFVTNPRDAEQLRQAEYRQRVAESLYTGVARYESGLAGARAPALKRAALQ